MDLKNGDGGYNEKHYSYCGEQPQGHRHLAPLTYCMLLGSHRSPQIQGKAAGRARCKGKGRCKQGDPPAKRLRSPRVPKMDVSLLSFKVCSSLWGRQVKWQLRPQVEDYPDSLPSPICPQVTSTRTAILSFWKASFCGAPSISRGKCSGRPT